jgi:hypothetical protein
MVSREELENEEGSVRCRARASLRNELLSELCDRTRKATVAVTRKLAVILHRMLRDGTEFFWSAKRVRQV